MIKDWWKKKRRFDLYLAGPMRWYKDLNKPLFTKAAKMLRDAGYTVWSPAEHKSYKQISLSECMKLDLNAVINQCDNVAVLPGWSRSLGANVEVFVATLCGKKIFKIVFSADETEFNLHEIDSNQYRLPYEKMCMSYGIISY